MSDKATCAVCNWTNVGLENAGEPGAPRSVCPGCLKRAADACSGAADPQPGELARARRAWHSICVMLGWWNDAPQDSIEQNLLALKARLETAERQRDQALRLLKALDVRMFYASGGAMLVCAQPASGRPRAVEALEALRKDGLLVVETS